MKKILTVAIVALLATASLFAGVKFSGRFRQGYVFSFGEKETTVSEWKSEEAKLVMKFSDDDGVWTVGLKATGDLDSNDKWAANATVDVKKLLAAADVDTGDFGLKLSLGNNGKMTALSAYDDAVTGNEYWKLKSNGKASFQLAATYDMVKFNVAVDPTTDGKTASVVSVLVAPVDGVSVGAAYAYKAWMADQYYDGDSTPAWTADNGINASFKVDVAELADLDFDLSVSAYENYLIGENDIKYSSLAANVYGGYENVSGGVEFVMGTAISKSSTESKTGINTVVNYAAADDLAFDAFFNILDLSDVSKTFTVGADATYSLAGIDFGLQLKYAAAKSTFSVRPSMVIVF